MLESRSWNELELARTAMEPEDAIKGLISRVSHFERQCSGNQRLAYIHLRASELQSQWERSNPQSVLALARNMSKRFPSSVQIATVLARLEGSVAAAEHAVSLDSSYMPAQVALASAYLSSGEIGRSEAIISKISGLDSTSEGMAVRSQIYFAGNKEFEAIQSAQQALSSRKAHPIEPDARSPKTDAMAHETLGLAFLKEHRYDSAARHLLAAAAFSPRAQSAIDSANSQLRQAIQKQEHSR